MSATSGLMYAMPLARWDRATSCWRTLPDTSLWDLPMSLGTLPAWGMTRGGVLFELPTPPRRISEPGSSSLPTPKGADGERGRDLPRLRPDESSRELATTVAMLPTPVVDHSRGLPQPESDYQSLPNVALSLLPTPAVNDMGAGKDPQAWDEWTERMKEAHGNGNGHGKSLEQEALWMLPTPRATRGGSATETVNLLPTPLAGSMGRNRNSPHQVGVDEAILSLLGTPTAAMSHRSPQGISKNPNPREIAAMVDQG